MTTHSAPRRGLIPLITVVAIAVALVALVILAFVLRDVFDPQARTVAAQQAQRAQQINDQLTGVDILAGAAWRLLPVLVVGGAAFVGLAALWRRYVPQRSIDQHFGVLIERARNTHPSVPAQQTLHYTQHMGRALPSAAMLLREQDEAEDADPDAPLTPTFAGLLSDGRIGATADGKAQPLILGFNQGDAITGDWKSLYSSGLGGLQGSGKTWTAAYLLAQSALAGARLVICDPHAGDEESLAVRTSPLAPALVCDVAEDERDILQALKLADAELQRRKHGHADRTPLIVAIDEWSSLRRGELAELLPRFIENFSTEGRKLNCHVMLLGQRWDKPSVGEFRNTLASSYVHRMRPDEARMMTGLRAAELPGDTLRLAPGCAYLLDTRGNLTRVQIPVITPADVAAVGRRLLPPPRPTVETNAAFGFRKPSQHAAGNQPETNGKAHAETKESASGRGETSAETARILALFFDDKLSVAEIVKTLWPESAAGRAYNERRAYVEGVIRDALQRRA